MDLVEGRTIRGNLPLVEDVRYEKCVFDNAGHRDGVLRNVEFVDCSAWALTFRNAVFEDCLIENLKTRIPGQVGGKTVPVFFWGCFARHLTIRGTVGGFMWSPPRTPSKVRWKKGQPEVVSTSEIDFSEGVIAKAEKFYSKVDWALDVSQARFRSVPSLSFGPPGELVRRDVSRQPLVAREVATSVDWRSLEDRIGIWWVTLWEFQQQPWPATTALIPALGGRKAAVEEELAGIGYLREAGMTVDEGA